MLAWSLQWLFTRAYNGIFFSAVYKYSSKSTSSAATDALSCITGGLEENQTNDQAVASPVISREGYIADSSKSTCDEAPEFRPFLLGTGYC